MLLPTSQVRIATQIPSAQKGWNKTRKGTKTHDKDPQLFTYA